MSSNALLPSDAVRLQIEGMTCASCVNRVERALRKVPGVATAEVNLATETAQVSLVDAATDIGMLSAAVEKAGYHAHVIQLDEPTKAEESALHSAWPVLVAALF